MFEIKIINLSIFQYKFKITLVVGVKIKPITNGKTKLIKYNTKKKNLFIIKFNVKCFTLNLQLPCNLVNIYNIHT